VKEAAVVKPVVKKASAKVKPRPKPSALIAPKPIDKLAEARESGKITIVSYKKVMQEPMLGELLDDKEKESLISGDIVIKDKRDPKDVTLAYKIQTPQRMESPTQTGLYDVLVRPGEFKKCLIINGPYTADGMMSSCLVMDVENKSWLTTHPSKIWTKNMYSREEYQKWFKDLPEGTLSKSEYGKKLLLGPTGQGTAPFSVTRENGGEVESYDVYFADHAKKKRSVNWPTHKEKDQLQQMPTEPVRLVCTDHQGLSLRALGSELIVPKGYKVIKLDQPTCGCDYDSNPASVIDLSSGVDLELGIIKSGELVQMNIRHTGSHVYIDDREFTPVKALEELVLYKGLREKQARDILANAKDQKTYQAYLKFADTQYELQRSSPSSPYFPDPIYGTDPIMGGKVATIEHMEVDMPITDLQARSYDRSGYDPRPEATSQPYMVGGSSKKSSSGPDKQTMETAMHAAETGQKEVFDTAMLGSMLKSVRGDSVDKYMGDLVKGMDRIARILFMLYWHMEEFEERYGKQDLPELEDGLRNAFEAVGDIVLFLKQKTIEPYPDEVGDVDLGSLAES
jgi:hypothetical protein